MTPDALENMLNFARLVPIGFIVAVYGALIGVGGGFVLVPLIFWIMPSDLSPTTVTSMSLTVVFFSSYAGTMAYARMKRIHYYYGILFTVAGIPAVILGTTAIRYVPRRPFAMVFGLLLLTLGVFLCLRPLRKKTNGDADAEPSSPEGEETAISPRRVLLGTIAAAYMRLCPGLLGIGGGIIQVPFLIKIMRFRPHVATATSLFILCLSSFCGVASHMVHDLLYPETSGFFICLDKAMYLAVGALIGAPVGAAISQRVQGPWIVRLLALAICGVGARLFWTAV